MATINLGAIKFNWKGAYNSSTTYAVYYVVSSGGNSYVCIQAYSNQAVGNATAYWNIMSSKGTDADLMNITSTAQGDIYYNNGSAIARLGAGTNGQALITGGASANPSWGTISSGTYSVHAYDSYNYNSEVVWTGAQQNYIDIAGGNTMSFTPTSTDDFVVATNHNLINLNHGDANGCDVYLVMGTSSTLGSSDTKLNYDGQHANYVSAGVSDNYRVIDKTALIECTGLTVGTQYYLEQAGANHVNGKYLRFNVNATGSVTGASRHFCSLVHYKKN